MTALQNYAEQNQYDLLSKFESLQEFNNHFEQAMALHKDKFTKSEYIALNKLRKFAANFFGVAWCKIQKAVAGTHQDEMFGVSRRTFDRMLAKVRSLNLVTVINQARKNKWQKHNVYVFNRIEELTPENFGIVSKTNTIDVPESLKIDAPITNLLLELPKLKDINTYQQADPAINQADKEIDLNKPMDECTDYDKLKNLIMSFTGDKKLAYKFYGIWLAQTSKMINKPDFELAMKAARATLRAIKDKRNTGKPVANPRGYFNNALSGMIDKWLESELYRYEVDWEQASLEDGSMFEKANDSVSPEELSAPIKVVNRKRLDRAAEYLKRKQNESVNDGSDKFLRRQLRLFKYDEILSEYTFAYASSLIEQPYFLNSSSQKFYNWLDDCES